MALIILHYVTVNFLRWYAVKFLCVMLSFIGSFVVLLLSVFRFTSFLAIFCSSLQMSATQVTVYCFYMFLLLHCLLSSHYVPLQAQQHQTRHTNNHCCQYRSTNHFPYYHAWHQHAFISTGKLFMYIQNSKTINCPPFPCYKTEKQ
jgi:hypothetical protein